MITLSDVLNGKYGETPVVAENYNTISENLAIMSEMYADIVMTVEEVNTFDCAMMIMESAGNPVVMEGFGEAVKGFFKKIGDFFKWIGQKLKNFFEKIKNKLFKKKDNGSDNKDYTTKIDLKEVFEGDKLPYPEMVDRILTYMKLGDEYIKNLSGLMGKDSNIDDHVYPTYRNPFGRDVGHLKARLIKLEELLKKESGEQHTYDKATFDKYLKILEKQNYASISGQFQGIGESIGIFAHTLELGIDYKKSKIPNIKERVDDLIRSSKELGTILVDISKRFFVVTTLLFSELGDAKNTEEAESEIKAGKADRYDPLIKTMSTMDNIINGDKRS